MPSPERPHCPARGGKVLHQPAGLRDGEIPRANRPRKRDEEQANSSRNLQEERSLLQKAFVFVPPPPEDVGVCR
ncbi:hypothetical protein NDU88_010944 [Pleurodeles waltl]|uniref:Uncharacterized protein n=1 Tax=Pleurodeles waltl TaxID=8319 RepID=A0AAV7QYZ5_PLEWA|nr:hypothetical protein NDU88_010944 [Pleurodeles waltl]